MEAHICSLCRVIGTSRNKAVHNFVKLKKKIALKSYKGIGVGENIRGSSSGVFLGGLFWEDKLVHLTSVSAK